MNRLGVHAVAALCVAFGLFSTAQDLRAQSEDNGDTT